MKNNSNLLFKIQQLKKQIVYVTFFQQLLLKSKEFSRLIKIKYNDLQKNLLYVKLCRVSVKESFINGFPVTVYFAASSPLFPLAKSRL